MTMEREIRALSFAAAKQLGGTYSPLHLFDVAHPVSTDSASAGGNSPATGNSSIPLRIQPISLSTSIHLRQETMGREAGAVASVYSVRVDIAL